ncbi:MAG TPA: hypothetical protein PK926_17610 [Spirochaetota bacterium]|nr:hypothetical protein [Spirochaetota bacterium]HPI90932.1 hypothetical protein [Spirochaetota bacterium]HPR47075.1 hypothetical protein [Spirochaetota bacterium]
MINKDGDTVMAIKEEELIIIGNYVQKQLPGWLDSLSYQRTMRMWDMELRERVVRVEEELKNQRELIKQGFEQVDRRIDQVDKRIDQMDKRIDHMDRRFELFEKRLTVITVLMGTGFTMLTVLISIFRFLS